MRAEGSTEWRRLRDFPEFASAAAAASPPPPGASSDTVPADSNAAPGMPVPIEFTGQWGEYFRIWIVNVLLTIVTLGIYAAWAKVRKRRYFCANTRLLGHTFEYLADPLKILYCNLIVVALFLVIEEPTASPESEQPDRIAILARLETGHRTGRPVLSPYRRIESVVGVQRRDQDVAVSFVAFRKAGIAGEPENNLVQHGAPPSRHTASIRRTAAF